MQVTKELLQTRRDLIIRWPYLPLPAVDADDRKILEKAFGKNGTGKSQLATSTINKLNIGTGRWLVCLCRGRIPKPPTLFFRDEHVVRHPSSSEHHTDCEFAKTVDDQTKLVGTYMRRKSKTFRLLKRFADYEKNSRGAPVQRREGRTRARSTLAALLTELWENAGIQYYPTSQKRPTLEQQISLIREHAETFFVHKNVSVESVLCTDAEELEDFKQSLIERKWPDGMRPQGVFISVVDEIRQKSVIAYPSGAEVEISDRIAIYGELSPDDRDEGEDDAPILIESDRTLGVRKFYVCMGVIGQKLPGDLMEVMSCYLHPCYKTEDLMLVDSGYERITMNQIISAAIGLRAQDIFLEVSKPLFDVSEEPRRRDGRARPVLIPDFVVWTDDVTVVVETLGYKSDAYRDRKAVIIPEMQAALNNASLACMDFHQSGVDLKDLKRHFRDELTAHFQVL